MSCFMGVKLSVLRGKVACFVRSFRHKEYVDGVE